METGERRIEIVLELNSAVDFVSVSVVDRDRDRGFEFTLYVPHDVAANHAAEVGRMVSGVVGPMVRRILRGE